VHRQALAALAAIRPAIARLDRSRGASDRSADIAESWAGVETALRALLGGSPVGGQQLIREARRRQLLSFDQANALAEFNAVRDRAVDAAYQPSDTDINAVRDGFVKFESSLSRADQADSPVQGEAMSTQGLRVTPLGTPRPVPLPPEELPPWVRIAVVLAVVVGIALGAWMLLRARRDTSFDHAVVEWQAGRRDAATSEFERLVRENPKHAMAHVYLARLAREGGNLTLAREHATLAVQAERGNGTALREMGATLLAARDFELARRFYVRALEAQPDDRAAQGYLGCTLLMLGRTDEGTRWLNRAGPGTWSGCVPPTPSDQSPRPR
jgi:tetratricopeptide (TPR) repeat protein